MTPRTISHRLLGTSCSSWATSTECAAKIAATGRMQTASAVVTKLLSPETAVASALVSPCFIR